MTLCELVIVIFIFPNKYPSTVVHSLNFISQPSKNIFAPSSHLHPLSPPPSITQPIIKKCSNNKCLHKKLIEKSSKLAFAGLSTLHAPPIAIFYNPRRRCVYPCCLDDNRSLPRIHQTFACVSARSCV